MTKAEIVSRMAQEANITKKEAEAALKAFVSALREALKNGERVRIPGLGVFSVRERKERKGRNPRTGEVITIPKRRVVHFRAEKSLRDSL